MSIDQLEFDFTDDELTFNEYQEWAATTMGPDADWYMIALGVGGETGEVLEVVKKGNRPGKTLDVEHLKEEIGDVLWYLANLATYYDIDLEEAMFDNMDKLEERYKKNGEKT